MQKLTHNVVAPNQGAESREILMDLDEQMPAEK